MRLFPILLICLSAGACAKTDLKLDEKTEAWNKKVQLEIPINSEKSKILNWGESNNFEFISQGDKTILAAILETIEDPGIVCSHWSIALEVEINQENRSIRNTVSKSGTCL